jgi:hypothetical protein
VPSRSARSHLDGDQDPVSIDGDDVDLAAIG